MMALRSGLTTGACAAAAAKAAVSLLNGAPASAEIELRLPALHSVRVPILESEIAADATAMAAVRKDAGDDPDVTHGLVVRATVKWSLGSEVTFAAGEGVGTVTKPGLQIAPGEPAINPAPRAMICQAVREITPRGVHVEIAIPGGREIAARTFNPRLGIVGGLSILGTTGIVRPYCTKALHDALVCALDVAAANGVKYPVLAPGNIGARAARAAFILSPEQLIEVGNEWGFVFDRLAACPFQGVLVVGHPGKLAKLIAGDWDTHSARSQPATVSLAPLWRAQFARETPNVSTIEGWLQVLEERERAAFAVAIAEGVRNAIAQRMQDALAHWAPSSTARANRVQTAPSFEVVVMLIDIAGRPLARAGDATRWQ